MQSWRLEALELDHLGSQTASSLCQICDAGQGTGPSWPTVLPSFEGSSQD